MQFLDRFRKTDSLYPQRGHFWRQWDRWNPLYKIRARDKTKFMLFNYTHTHNMFIMYILTYNFYVCKNMIPQRSYPYTDVRNRRIKI